MNYITLRFIGVPVFVIGIILGATNTVSEVTGFGVFCVGITFYVTTAIIGVLYERQIRKLKGLIR